MRIPRWSSTSIRVCSAGSHRDVADVVSPEAESSESHTKRHMTPARLRTSSMAKSNSAFPHCKLIDRSREEMICYARPCWQVVGRELCEKTCMAR